MKKIIIRGARKSAHLSSKFLDKGLRVANKIENKATRILNGTDYSFKTDNALPLEKIYYNTLPFITPLNPALPAIGSEPTITLLLPTLDGKSFYGGTATALVVAARLAQLKERKLRIVQTLKTGHANDLEGFLKREGINFSGDRIKIISVAGRAYDTYGYIPLHPDDLFVASAWWDAHLIGQLPLKHKFLYLIQDFEPIFYNNSDQYVLAEETYKLSNYIPLCNTQLMYDFMRNRSYGAFKRKESYWFEPAVSRAASGLTRQKKAGEKKRIFVYGRPDVHRNLFFSALTSIDHAFKADFLKTAEWEVYMAGQDKIPDIKLTSGIVIKNLGKMPMEEYVKFSKSIDVAVSLMMAPHPNYPTLEFASIGSAVVTTKYANKQNLTNYSDNIVTSDIGTESLAGAINQAAKLSYKARIENTRHDSISADWKDSLDKTLLQCIKGLDA